MVTRSWIALAIADAPPLGDDEVHVWWLPLQLSATLQRELEPLLSPHERAEPSARKGGDRGAQLASRAFRRLLLARYCGEPAAALRFGTAAFGKPRLLPSAVGAASLEFSAARRGEVGVLAIARGAVGVDIEHPLEDPEAQQAVAAWLEPDEQRALGALPADARAKVAAWHWTALEARAKFGGTGLARLLDHPSASSGHGSARAPVHRFVLEDDPAGIHIPGALACATPSPVLRLFRLRIE